MAHPSDRAAARISDYLAQAEAHLRVDARGPALSRSHTADSRTVSWFGPSLPGHRLAIDAEVTDAPVPPALAARFGTRSFWAGWTRAESLAKVFGVPIVVWLRRHGLRVPPLAGTAGWRTLTLADLTVSVACVPAAAHDAGRG